MITRRRMTLALLAGPLAGLALPALARVAPRPALRPDDLEARLAALESETGGRLGVAVLDASGGFRAGHRQDERFPLCSTFKVLLAAQVLARCDQGVEDLERPVRVRADDLLDYAPVTRPAVGRDLSVATLCEAAITLSDNTAANLLLARSGGPAGLTAFLRSLGDEVTRLDRIEPDLNEARPGDPRDTTSPAAMLHSLQRLLLGDALAPASRDRLEAWMVATRTGDARLRARLPADWRAGDKTGTGARGTYNDVALFRPPQGSPWLVSAYLTGASAPAARCEAALAEVGALIAGT